MRSSRIAIGVSIALAGAYGWWLAGLRPFTTTAYLAIALPTALLVAALALPRPGRRTARGAPDDGSPTPSGRQFLPLAIVLVLGLGLEMAGLALGGRSALVPTLSTVLDHLLRWQFVRYLLILAWLAVGFLLGRRGRRPVSPDGG
jgi:chromate transport protein ChrA